MPDRFDKFTERARRVLTHAQEESQRLNHTHIGTEHLLLGLLKEPDGVGARVLLGLGADLTKLGEAIERLIAGAERPVSGEIGLTSGAKKVIGLAVDEARQLNHDYIGTEHLLAGLVREGEGVAFGALQSLGVTIDSVRAQTASLLRQNPGASSAAAASSRAGRPLALWPDPAARIEAQDAIQAAVAAAAGFSGTPFERELLEALLLPQLASLNECLSLASGSTAAVLTTRRWAEEILRSMTQAAGVLRAHGHEEIAQALETAGTAVTRAIAS